MGSTYLVKLPARSLVAHADDERHGFLLGTAALREANEIRLLRYYEEDDEIECAAVYSHRAEVVGLAACPTDPSLVATVYNAASMPSAASPAGDAGAGLRATLWRMPDLPRGDLAGDADGDGVVDATQHPPKELQPLAHIPVGDGAAAGGAAGGGNHTGGGAGRSLHVQWFPGVAGGNGDAGGGAGGVGVNDGAPSVLDVTTSGLRVWALRTDGGAALTAKRSIGLGVGVSFVGGAAWDPHHRNEVAVAADSALHCYDLRTGERARSIAGVVPAGCCVRALSYNPNKPWQLATGGDDFRVKLWDLRRTATPVKVLDGHTHWVTSLAFNPFHDQLLASGGADARLNLWRVSSVSSAPLLELGDEELDPATGRKVEPKLAADAAIRSHEDHDDTVAAVAWSAHNAWVYASLSYPGKMLVCQVPSAEKYKILL